ncbi:hypothetical protein QAD02_006573 [Eretmocerus hayati]|uniref:Uncharacterized protein n=1 Tax=Eretmocerus hayati TaxID=131215 RepID=A0ACC2N1M3_9HYME|nr:hypothetical protein QAD02_006573 [Eretmocerus hayati]
MSPTTLDIFNSSNDLSFVDCFIDPASYGLVMRTPRRLLLSLFEEEPKILKKLEFHPVLDELGILRLYHCVPSGSEHEYMEEGYVIDLSRAEPNCLRDLREKCDLKKTKS